MQVLIDDRENKSRITKAIGYFEEQGDTVNVDHLEIGDYIINNEVVFEYKTLEDFVNSVKSRRVFNQAVDHIICFNAYPHFLDREEFARIAASSIKVGGILCIVHDLGRKQLDAHHDAHAKGVSRHLLPAEEESKVFQKDFEVLEIIDNEDEYKIVLKRRPR